MQFLVFKILYKGCKYATPWFFFSFEIAEMILSIEKLYNEFYTVYEQMMERIHKKTPELASIEKISSGHPREGGTAIGSN